MKYLGENSLSSVLNIFFQVAWYVVLVVSVIMGIIGFFIILASSFHDPSAIGGEHFQGQDWEKFQQLPGIIKLFFLFYFGVLVALMLKIIKKSQQLFSNFRNNIVFDEKNVINISKIGKLMVWFAILTFDLGTLFVSLLLLMLCEIFKNGAALQEEHDLTV